jgi:hypothetical protein
MPTIKVIGRRFFGHYMEGMLSAGNPAGWEWHRSSACNGGDCVEIASLGDMIKVRDSARPDGGILSFSRDQWVRFLVMIRAGLPLEYTERPGDAT